MSVYVIIAIAYVILAFLTYGAIVVLMPDLSSKRVSQVLAVSFAWPFLLVAFIGALLATSVVKLMGSRKSNVVTKE